MRVLVFTLLFVLGLLAYSQEIPEGPAKDPLNGYTAEIPPGWKARNSEYGLIFSKNANFIVIRGKKTTDQRTIASLLLEESKRTSPTGSLQTAYKKTSNGFVLYIEDAGYPYYLEDPANVPFMFQVPVPRNYQVVHYVLSQKTVSLIVSLYLPRDGEVYKDEIVKILSSFAFLPPNERISWRYAKIVEPMNGMTAVLMPVPDGFNFSGSVVEQGTKRWFIYSLRRSDGSAIRIDLVDVNSGALSTAFGGNADTVLTINGSSSLQPNFICIRGFDDAVALVVGILNAIGEGRWSKVWEKEFPFSISNKEQAISQSVPTIPGSVRVRAKGAVLLSSDRGMERLVSISLSGTYGQNPSYVATSINCSANMTLTSVQAPKGKLREIVEIAGGVYSNIRVNPEWGIFTYEYFMKTNKELNRMVMQMQKDSQEFNSWMSKSWANVLSDQTYVRDPSTGEVFRVYKKSWETGEFWREPVFQDVILGGVKEGSKLQELLQMEGWKKLEESLGGFR
jgi:hypothetical protein